MRYEAELTLLKRHVPEIYHQTELKAAEVSYKQKNEIVTSSDLFIETELIRLIKEHFPNDRFHSEEFNRETGMTDRTWLIDPIDGTSNYAHGLDMFVVQIALYDQGEIVLAFIYAPRVRKTYYAVKGEGAYLNNQRISVDKGGYRPNRLMSMVGLSHQTTKDKYLFRHMIDFSYANKIKIRILGTLGFEMAAMAEGSFIILYTDVTNYWDVAPGLCLIREAGGFVINQLGEPYTMGDPHMIACCDEEILKKVTDSLPEDRS